MTLGARFVPCVPMAVSSLSRSVVMRDGRDRFSFAPFLEPAIATGLTAALTIVLAASGVGESLLKDGSGPDARTPYTEAKNISFGVLDGCVCFR
jgi:hypothetical protein